MAKSKDSFNPFPTTKYIGSKYFCDRELETKKLKSAFKNDRPVTIFSMRRMGKTGLIKHLQNDLSKSNKNICIYVDIFNTESDQEFVTKLVNATITAINNSKKGFFFDIIEMFSKYTPKFTLDPLTGAPGIELDIRNKSDVKLSLAALFNLLKNEKRIFHIAIDEFQQIANYESSSIASTLREYMQEIKNIRFLFSGSQRHLLLNLFNNPKQPLYRMVDQLLLTEISYSKYKEFIIEQFENAGRKINTEVVDELLNWSRRHTFYVQVICNKLFGLPKKTINNKDLNQIKSSIKKELEMNFIAYKNLLTKNQYKTLKGIAKENSVKSVRTKNFTNKYKLAPSTANQSLKYLVNAEIIYEKITKEGSEYMVYDVFFHRWLQEDG